MAKKLLLKVKKFPLTSGIYIFRDGAGNILYVGRATSLRRRVLNYFQKNLLDSRIREMVALAKSVNYQKTDSVLGAIILEANLIKKYGPKYNVKDRDDRSFLYIVIPKNADWPRPIIVRKRELQKFPSSGTNVFGPYQSLAIVKNALNIIRRIFPYSICRTLSGKPCSDYQVGLCPGACIGEISKEDYQKNIDNIILLLSGRRKKLMAKLRKENPEKSKSLKFIQDVSLISKEELVSASGAANRIEGYDISHLSGRESYGSMVVFTNSDPDKNNYRLFKIKESPASDDLRALKEVLMRRLRHGEWRLPDIILIDGGKPQIDFIYKLLKDRHANIALVGISKLGGDKLVFPTKTKKSIKDLAKSVKPILLQVRDEAHRFAISAGRRKRRKIM